MQKQCKTCSMVVILVGVCSASNQAVYAAEGHKASRQKSMKASAAVRKTHHRASRLNHSEPAGTAAATLLLVAVAAVTLRKTTAGHVLMAS